MCLPIPIDAVYTWVNGSDPKLIADLQRVKEKLEKDSKKDSEEEEKKLIQCKDDNCVPGPLIVFSAVLPGSPQTEELARSHIAFLQQDRAFNLTKSGRENMTVAQFEKQSVVDVIMKEKPFVMYKGRNISLSRGFLTSDWRAEGGVELKDMAFVSNIGKNVTEEQLQRKIPEDQRENVRHIDLTSSAGVAVITLKTAEVTRVFITEFEKSEGENGMKVGPAYLLWGLEKDTDHEEDISKSRFEDNEEMRYSLRSLEQNAPWIRHVYIVTNGQIPSWLNLDNPRITLITHEDIFPNKSHLPTFSSPAIESHLHLIPGLSDKFIYLNDDTMFGVPVWPDDFYTHSQGQKVYLTWPVPNCAEGCPPSWIRDNYCDTACNNSECDWDGGDCDGVSKPGPVGGGVGGDVARDTPDLYCNPGCANSWIADRYCDQTCNVAKCGFDAGDCGVDNFPHLFGVDIKGPVNITIPKGVTAFFLNLTVVFDTNSSITEAQYDDHKIVRTATVAQKYKLITVLLHENVSDTLIGVNVSGRRNDDTLLSVSFNMTVNSIPVTEKALTVVKEGEEKTVTEKEDEMSKVVFHDIPEHDRGPQIHLNANKPAVEMPAIDLESLSEEIALKLAELNKKFSDGDITEKGHKKYKAQILQEYIQSPEYANRVAGKPETIKETGVHHQEGDFQEVLQNANGKSLPKPGVAKSGGEESIDGFKRLKFRHIVPKPGGQDAVELGEKREAELPGGNVRDKNVDQKDEMLMKKFDVNLQQLDLQQPFMQQQLQPSVQKQQRSMQQQQPVVQQQQPNLQKQPLAQQQPGLQQEQLVQQQHQLGLQQQPIMQQQDKPLVQQQQPFVQQQMHQQPGLQQQPLAQQQQPFVQWQQPGLQQQQPGIQQQPPVQQQPDLQQQPLMQQQDKPFVQQQQPGLQLQQPGLQQQPLMQQPGKPFVQQQQPGLQLQQPGLQQQPLMQQQDKPLVQQKQPLVQQQQQPVIQQQPLAQQKLPQPKSQSQPLDQQQHHNGQQQQPYLKQQPRIQQPEINPQQQQVNAQQFPQEQQLPDLKQQPQQVGIQQQPLNRQQPFAEEQKQHLGLQRLQQQQLGDSEDSKFVGAGGGEVQPKQAAMDHLNYHDNKREVANQEAGGDPLGARINPRRPPNINNLQPVLFNRKPPQQAGWNQIGQAEQHGPQNWREPILINQEPVAHNRKKQRGDQGIPADRNQPLGAGNQLPLSQDRVNPLALNRPAQQLPADEKFQLPETRLQKQEGAVKEAAQQDVGKRTGLNQPNSDPAKLDQGQGNMAPLQPNLVPKDEEQKRIVGDDIPKKKFYKGRRKETGRKFIPQHEDNILHQRKLLSVGNYQPDIDQHNENRPFLKESPYLNIAHFFSAALSNLTSSRLQNSQGEPQKNRVHLGIGQKHPGKQFVEMRDNAADRDRIYKKSDITVGRGTRLKKHERGAVAVTMDDVTDEEAEQLVEDADQYLRKTSFLPWERKEAHQEKRKKSDYQTTSYRSRKPLDTFADSLIHVNRIYNKRFGFIARKVPGHIPHMIDINIMKELQAEFPDEFDATSSHQIRHSKDMQFAFSYMYYVIGSPKEVNTNEIFDEFDTDHSGVLSDREIRTLATRLFELPLDLQTLSSLENNFIQCAKNLSREVYEDPSLTQEKYYEEKMPQVTKALVAKCSAVTDLMQKSVKGQTNYKYEILGDEDIAFKMIRTNVSQVIGQLDDIRKNPKKFVCLNDNIDHASPEAYMVKAVLQDFYEALFPIVSQFELPREYRNRFLHVDELREWRRYRDWLRFWTQLSLLALIAFSIASFCSRQLLALKRRCCPRRRTKMSEIAEKVQHV
ncbi:N-acetylglucosamine-1-phosphotransferase subunits alpha/beta-like isoform X2 [Acanthaster planci]|nr:N-acetylglucosamine-1-phosphotransferase subunits alpha/beta-like isoform X2 [Acanthaster planci]